MAGTAEPSAAGGSATGIHAAALWRERLLSWCPLALSVTLAAGAISTQHLLWGPALAQGPLLWLGGLLTAAGLTCTVWAWGLFRRVHTPLAPFATPLVLVEEGPYRVSRHPMYLGLAVALVGMTLVTGLPLLALVTALFITLVATVHIPHEEAQLERRFGGWYRDYRATTRRWV